MSRTSHWTRLAKRSRLNGTVGKEKMKQIDMKEIDSIIETLSSPLSKDEASSGWTNEVKCGIKEYFIQARVDVVKQEKSPALRGLIRGLDACGVLWKDNDLANACLRVNRMLINAGYSK